MKYNATAFVFYHVFSHLLKQYAKEHPLTLDFHKIKKEYSNMIYRTPELDNDMKSNLIGACYFFSLAKTVPEMTPDTLDDIIQQGLYSDLMWKLHKGQRKKGTMFTDKVQDKKVKEAKLSQKSTNIMDWTFTYEKKKDEFYMTYTRCGLCELARREHMQDYLPCMCKMDYGKYKMAGGIL